MLFNSPEFAYFFVAIFAIYYIARPRYRVQNLILLVASYVFYGWWDVRFLFLIALSTGIDYFSALMIDQGKLTKSQRWKTSFFLIGSAVLFVGLQYGELYSELVSSGLGSTRWSELQPDRLGLLTILGTIFLVALGNLLHPVVSQWNEQKKRKFFLAVSILSNLAILGFFKYFNFFSENLAELSQLVFGITPSAWTLNIVLPVGISFYTFQTMSYTIDVYRRELDASRNLTEFATYVAFFPQLVAGPIERGKHLLPQFREARPALDRERFRDGAWLITWGLFKKMVIADNMAVIVNENFAPYDQGGFAAGIPDDGLRLLLVVYAFALQIYGDFSGYTDIARGTARLLGFNIMLNFSLPYFATSPSSFWRRWHISLSTWLRDYLYIPLGGNRGGGIATSRNLALTMLLGGLWHGAAWNFVVWGAYHGALLGIYRALGLRTENRALPWPTKAVMGLIMFHLTCIGWLIFRATNLGTIGAFLEAIVTRPNWSTECTEILKHILFYSWFLIGFQIVQARTRNLNPLPDMHWFIRLNVWIFVIMSILTLARSTGEEFIYFAF